MSMEKDLGSVGTNLDGSKSDDYCSCCFEEGEFTQPDFSAKDMQKFCSEKLNNMGIPSLFSWILTRKIPKLKRWSLTPPSKEI
jgi:hypothetical protein